MMPELPIRLDDLLAVIAARGSLNHLLIGETSRGDFQASFRGPGGRGYRVVMDEDPVAALVVALGPAHGDSWAEVIGDDLGPLMDAWEAERRSLAMQDDEDDSEDLL